MKRYARKSNAFIFREIAGELLLVPLRQKAGEAGNIFTLEGIGSQIWSWLEEARSVDELQAMIVEEYEVTQEQARQDSVMFLEQLGEIGAVEEIDSDG